jgi:histidine ammonia-lyase
LPLISALSADAFDCRPEPFEAPLHRIRPHHGQVHVAQQMRELLAQSPMAALPKKQVQDPYSFRCIPQVHGASWDALNHCFSVWETELNAVTDNPNVFEEENRVLSGGNFHGQPLALTLDYAAMALAEWANISERRTYLLIGGQRGLKPYLADDPGLDSGYMIAQYSAAALVSQNKQLCTPASVDSIVSSNGQEYHVSMGANAATKLLRVVDNVERVLAIEWLTACKAMGQRKAYNQSQGLTDQSNPELEAKWAEFEALMPGTHQDIPMETLIELSRSYLFG